MESMDIVLIANNLFKKIKVALEFIVNVNIHFVFIVHKK
jgi:hypothetical protein